jgi:hypothetical protein
MPSSHQEFHLQNRGERRSIPRTIIKRDVLIFFAGQIGVLPCCVHDVTNLGAGINLNNLRIVPLEFELSLDNFRTTRKCHLMWRNDDFAGVKFLT